MAGPATAIGSLGKTHKWHGRGLDRTVATRVEQNQNTEHLDARGKREKLSMREQGTDTFWSETRSQVSILVFRAFSEGG
jgi:hypothetical protein